MAVFAVLAEYTSGSKPEGPEQLLKKEGITVRVIVQFDCDADMISVPDRICGDLDSYRSKFLKWIYGSNSKHRYWVEIADGHGSKYRALRYRSDAFVEWLNKKVLDKSEEKATVIQQYLADRNEDMPTVCF